VGFTTSFSGPLPPRRLLGRPEARELAESRLPWILGGMVLWIAALFLRLLWLQVVRHGEFQHKAAQQHVQRVTVAAVRGELRDRRGESLAVSVREESLFCTPSVFYPQYRGGRGEERHWGEPDRKAAEAVAARLAPVLEMPRARVLELLLRKKTFVWIERQLSSTRVEAVKALKLDGLGFMPESRRYYPRGSLGCQILGFTNIDGEGQLGIERAFDAQLRGKQGEVIAPRDARGRLLSPRMNYSRLPVNGSTLQLTLDATIQHIVEQTLEEAVQQYHPLTAYAVVVDPSTGEILAMAGTPTFDPNHMLPKKFRNRSESEWSAAEKEEYRQELERQKAARKVHPLEDAYEPGSTMKIFTAAIALEERKVHLGEAIYCENGRWAFGGKLTITDTHRHGSLSFEEVLWQSSNIGSAKIGMRLDPAVHHAYLRKFGFGEATGLGFPGETAGHLPSPDRWSGTTQPTLSYGYGLSVSPLQILMAGCAIANGGKLLQPYLVQKVFNDQGVLLQDFKPRVRQARVISEETSAMMREVLKGVITQGTAKRAQLEGGVEAFGKTGTARKYQYGYDARHHYASFMGFFPADKPQYGMLFMFDEPGGGATGGDVAAPMFKKIGDAILRYRSTTLGRENNPDLRLSLRDWPTSRNDEAVVHVQVGLVPELRGLDLRSAIHRVVLAGGRPRVEGAAPRGEQALRVKGQSPAPGQALAPGDTVRVLMGEP
jgi:cell division protein FtsI/penicillin-binding protein 2